MQNFQFDIFVDEEAHLSSGKKNVTFVGEQLRGQMECGLNMLSGQTWIVVYNLRDRFAGLEKLYDITETMMRLPLKQSFPWQISGSTLM